MKSNLIDERRNAVNKAYADEKMKNAYDEYIDSLKTFCKVRLGEAGDFANDCVQETYCVYYKRLLNGEIFENPRAFLYKTANIMVLRAKEKYFKNAQRTKSLEQADNLVSHLDDYLEQDFDIEFAKEILISKLNDNEKKLYQMKYVQGKSLKEIGQELDIPPGAVANRTSRLRAKVKKLLDSSLSESIKGGG